MPFVIYFRIDKWTESMLSITSSQECSILQLVIPIVEYHLTILSILPRVSFAAPSYVLAATRTSLKI